MQEQVLAVLFPSFRLLDVSEEVQESNKKQLKYPNLFSVYPQTIYNMMRLNRILIANRK
jgi:hypothetical protein